MGFERFKNMKNFDLSFYRNKKILITGHTGFKGSWLVQALLTVNAKIIGISYDKPIRKLSMIKILKLEKEIIQINFDLSKNEKKLNEILNYHKPQFIFNLAAQALVKKSISDPSFTIRNNILINLNLLEVLRKINFQTTVIFITSDKVYENFEFKRGYVEDDILGGKDPYSASKSSSEIIISSYMRSFLLDKKNISIGIARAGNVIGGGDWSDDRIIPDYMRSCISKKKVIIRNPNSTRPWQHVLEPIFGYLYFAYLLNIKNKFNGQAFNFGPNHRNINKTKVINVIKELNNYFPDMRIEIYKKKDNKESNLLSLNINKANKFLNWSPKLTFNESIKLTAEWYNAYFIKTNMSNFTKDQINNYYNKLKNL